MSNHIVVKLSQSNMMNMKLLKNINELSISSIGQLVCSSNDCTYFKEYQRENISQFRTNKKKEEQGHYCTFCNNKANQKNCRDLSLPSSFKHPPRKMVITCQSCESVYVLYAGRHSCPPKGCVKPIAISDSQEIASHFQRYPKLSTKEFVHAKQTEALKRGKSEAEIDADFQNLEGNRKQIESMRKRIHRSQSTSLNVLDDLKKQAEKFNDSKLLRVVEDDIFLSSSTKVMWAHQLVSGKNDTWIDEGISIGKQPHKDSNKLSTFQFIILFRWM